MQCEACQEPLVKSQVKYCSNSCQKDFQYTQYIYRWLAGEVNGNRGKNTFAISKHITRYLHEKYASSCSACGWSVKNPITNKVPLEIDHIDGDYENNSESNLQLLCPNCHSLTPNYKNLNKGHGRLWRREKYVKIENVPL